MACENGGCAVRTITIDEKEERPKPYGFDIPKFSP